MARPAVFFAARSTVLTNDQAKHSKMLGMKGQSKLQSSRYEYKYLIDAPRAREIRNYIRLFLRPDDFTNPESGRGYPVHSHYLDSPDLRLCRQTICGEKNRFKLRVRFYDDSPPSAIFLEVKRRTYDAIRKRRVAVWRSSLPSLLADFVPDRRFLVEDDDRNFDDLRTFCEFELQRISVPKYVECMNVVERSRAGNSASAPRIDLDSPLRITAQIGDQ